jgi:hypothetical protein
MLFRETVGVYSENRTKHSVGRMQFQYIKAMVYIEQLGLCSC